MLLLLSDNFFQNKLFSKNYFFQKILSETLSECQTVKIQIRTDILSVLIGVQTVCKCYQQTKKSPLAMKELKGTLANSVDPNDKPNNKYDLYYFKNSQWYIQTFVSQSGWMNP